jgi:putative nucleotidyltransferase-like protein
MLCAVLGGQNRQALTEAASNQLLPRLFNMAQAQDLLPALAVRCEEHDQIGKQALNEQQQNTLTQTLRDNTKRNMQISAQALKLTKQLNQAGITPLFLKGTIQLLDPGTKNLGFRKQIDIDLLVEPKQLEAAAEVFLADGYGFYEFSVDPTSEPTRLRDTSTAIKRSAAHHHLPPLVKDGYATTVELHRHFLPRRFQRRNPLQPLFSTASNQQSHGASFLIPSAQYQIIHLLLGKVIHDGHLAGRTFPIREACDYIKVLESEKGNINEDLVAQHCGEAYPIFSQLVAELMMYKPGETIITTGDISHRLQMMQKRYNSPGLAKLLDAHARALHLGYSLLHSPAKLPAYLNRFK